jgi:hypothetical protein
LFAKIQVILSVLFCKLLVFVIVNNCHLSISIKF